MSVASGTDTTWLIDVFGRPMPPGDQGEPAGVPGTCETTLPEVAEVPARAHHVEGHAALIEGDQEAAEAVVERVDVVEEPEDVGFAPGQDLAADAGEERALLEVKVGEEEALPDAGASVQAADPAVDVSLGQLAADERRRFRQVGAELARRAARIAVLRRTVVVDAFPLAAVLDGVFEHVRVERAERGHEPPALLRDAPEVVLPVDLQEVAVLAQMPGGRTRPAERVVIAADALGADAYGGIRAQTEPHLPAAVDVVGRSPIGAAQRQHECQRRCCKGEEEATPGPRRRHRVRPPSPTQKRR
jgi:hypothetical protein